MNVNVFPFSLTGLHSPLLFSPLFFFFFPDTWTSFILVTSDRSERRGQVYTFTPSLSLVSCRLVLFSPSSSIVFIFLCLSISTHLRLGKCSFELIFNLSLSLHLSFSLSRFFFRSPLCSRTFIVFLCKGLSLSHCSFWLPSFISFLSFSLPPSSTSSKTFVPLFPHWSYFSSFLSSSLNVYQCCVLFAPSHFVLLSLSLSLSKTYMDIARASNAINEQMCAQETTVYRRHTRRSVIDVPSSSFSFPLTSPSCYPISCRWRCFSFSLFQPLLNDCREGKHRWIDQDKENVWILSSYFLPVSLSHLWERRE